MTRAIDAVTLTPAERYAYMLQRPDAPRILDLYRQGLTYAAIAEQVGRNVTYVNRVVLAAGLPRPLRLHPRLLALHEQGVSVSEIARRLNLKANSVYRALRERDLLPVKRPRYPASTRRQAVELHRRGLSCAVISGKLCVPRSTVYRWLRAAAGQAASTRPGSTEVTCVPDASAAPTRAECRGERP